MLRESVMRTATAKAVTDLLLRHSAEQNELLKQVQVDEPALEFQKVRTMIGKTMGAIYLDALHPIFEEHPGPKPAHLP